jgi:hypothetical protein
MAKQTKDRESEKLDKPLMVNLTAHQLEQTAMHAKASGRKVGAMARRMMEEWLEQHELVGSK